VVQPASLSQLSNGQTASSLHAIAPEHVTRHAHASSQSTPLRHAWSPLQLTSQRPSPHVTRSAQLFLPEQSMSHDAARSQRIRWQAPSPHAIRQGRPTGHVTSAWQLSVAVQSMTQVSP
jgi:hypothetical protein